MGTVLIFSYLNMENMSCTPFIVNIIIILIFHYRLDELNAFKM